MKDLQEEEQVEEGGILAVGSILISLNLSCHITRINSLAVKNKWIIPSNVVRTVPQDTASLVF